MVIATRIEIELKDCYWKRYLQTIQENEHEELFAIRFREKGTMSEKKAKVMAMNNGQGATTRGENVMVMVVVAVAWVFIYRFLL